MVIKEIVHGAKNNGINTAEITFRTICEADLESTKLI